MIKGKNVITVTAIVISMLLNNQYSIVLADNNLDAYKPVFFEEISNNSSSSQMFRASFLRYNVVLNKKEALFILKSDNLDSSSITNKIEANDKYYPIRLKFLNSSNNLKLIGTRRVSESFNYSYSGKDINLFERVMYSEIYPGIDIIYYGKNDDLAFDFVLKPSSDINSVVFEFEGIESLNLDSNNNLILQFSNNRIRQLSPKIFKAINGENKEVKGNFIIKNKNQIGFIIIKE